MHFFKRWTRDWLNGTEFAPALGRMAGMKPSPSDLRFSAITVLIATGLGLLFCAGPIGWFLVPVPLFAGIGAMLPRPIVSATIGAVLGVVAACLIFNWLSIAFSGG